ncbi:MAG TPA: methionyl-tRNA formyltransferase [Stellaceae bacterium]|nr:methionyl-tRNA formyltransferase [Stellaceae bacterium]
MRLALIGQQAFGRAALDKFRERGDEIAGVFVAPEKPGSKPDPLRARADELGIPVFQFQRYSAEEPLATLRGLAVDIGVMAYVTQFVPQSFVTIPKHGTIQFHPSLLPAHRGPSSINWPIMLGKTETGLTIFRPSDGLDEGPVVLQKKIAIGPDDTLGSVYFDRIFPQGVAALVEAADLVVAGRAPERVQDESQASYEGWVRDAESRISWGLPLDVVYNVIRGCNPQPGAWTTLAGKRLQIFDSRKIPARTFGSVKGLKLGQVSAMTAEGFTVHAQGGFIEVLRCRIDNGAKIAGKDAGIAVGTLLE